MGANIKKINRKALVGIRRASLGATALTGIMLATSPASAIVINDNFTPTQVVDTNNITGVGQMVIDLQNGFIGLCTATLINPRTVLFASHCVNENADETAFKDATTYGAGFGGSPIGFFFNANNNAAGNSAIGHWLNGNAGGPQYQTSVADNAYNSNFVVYNTNCCTIGLGNNFLQSDIAMAALDTPAVGIPTWTTLFSALTAPAHATIEGYGDNGIGTTGQGTIDFKRRVAENIVDVLGSLDDQDTFLFGAPDGLPANLYMLDFNDPKFGTAGANVFDFNIFHDVALPREGITAPGDSGGPLIIDHQFTDAGGNPVSTIAGVLSGGDRFFNAQPGASYGTTSFYQPLYLYWDWIVANNPYKYVGNKAGDGLWTDPNHWQMNLDPAYMTIDASGNLVNALPTTPAAGEADVPPGFGEVCYFDDCVDLKTGIETNPSPPATPGPTSGTGPFGGLLGQAGFVALVQQFVAAQDGQSGGPAVVSDSMIDGGVDSDPAHLPGGSILESEGSAQSDWTNPEGSSNVGGESVQGAPGSTLGAAPDDTDGDPTTGAPARYYDVTLAADGNTTLSAATITVDRLTINGANTALTIASDGHLTSLIDTTLVSGTMQVDGTYNSVGAITMYGGVLGGNGTVTAPTIASLMGVIAPGTIGTAGTLTLDGNLALSSLSTYLVDATAGGDDLLKINGTAAIDGFVGVDFANGYPVNTPIAILTATGGVTGTFADIIAMNAPDGRVAKLSYDADDVFLDLSAFIWGATPATGDWNTATNWQFGQVPTAADPAIFAASTMTTVSITQNTNVDSLVFDPGAPAYTFNVSATAGGGTSFTLANGITNDSSNAPTLTATGTAANVAAISFDGGTAANATLITGNNGGFIFGGNSDAGGLASLVGQGGGTFLFLGTGPAGDGNVSAGSIAGNATIVLNGNTLTVGALGTSTDFGGEVVDGSAPSALVKTGTGTLILSGSNVFTGGTTISQGTLQLGNGGTGGSIAGDVVDNAALVFDRSDNNAFAGAISGTGSVTQAGTGNLVLMATNTYTGPTTVLHGILTVAGSIASSTVTVQSGAQLAGTGTVGATTVTSGASLAPGSAGTIGTLKVSGNLNLASGSTLLFDTTGAISDSLIITGTLTAAGALAVSDVGGYVPHAGDVSLIATATTITGSFSSVTDNLSGILHPVVSIVPVAGGQEAILTVTAGSLVGALTNPTPDQITLATVLDNARATHSGDLAAIYNAIDPLSDGALGQALEDLAPDIERSIGLTEQLVTGDFSDLVRERLGEIQNGSQGTTPTSGFRINGAGLKNALSSVPSFSPASEPFAELGERLADASGPTGVASLGDMASDAGGSSGRGDALIVLPGGTGGFLTGRSLDGDIAIGGGGGKAAIDGYLIGLGVDFAVSEHFTVGAVAAFGEADTTLMLTPGTTKATFAEGGVYGRYDDENLFVTGFFSDGGMTIKTHRLVVIGPTVFDIRGKTRSDLPALGFTIGKTFGISVDDSSDLYLIPSAGFQFEGSGYNAFKETGGPAAMIFPELDDQVPTIRLGVDAKKSFDLGGFTVTPMVHLALVSNLDDDNGTTQALFAAAPETLMSFASAPRTGSYGELGLGANIDITQVLGTSGALSVRYDSNFGRDDLFYRTWSAQLKLAF